MMGGQGVQLVKNPLWLSTTGSLLLAAAKPGVALE